MHKQDKIRTMSVRNAVVFIRFYRLKYKRLLSRPHKESLDTSPLPVKVGNVKAAIRRSQTMVEPWHQCALHRLEGHESTALHTPRNTG